MFEVDLIDLETKRAEVYGISRETLPTAREGQLEGYLAGLKAARNLITTGDRLDSRAARRSPHPGATDARGVDVGGCAEPREEVN